MSAVSPVGQSRRDASPSFRIRPVPPDLARPGRRADAPEFTYDGTNFIDPDHVRFIQGCRDHFETDTFVFTHPNVDPDMPMDRQPPLKLRWEFVDPTQQCAHVPRMTVVVGHSPQTSGDLMDLGFLVLIDTDCSQGGWLSAYDPLPRRFVQANEFGEVREVVLSGQPGDRSGRRTW